MQIWQSLQPSRWDGKYHGGWIPKCRKKKLYGPLRKELGSVFHELARQKECQIMEGHLLGDHVPMLISIPPKYAVAQVIGFIKGKSAIHVARTFGGRKKNFTGQSFWARGSWRRASKRGPERACKRGPLRVKE